MMMRKIIILLAATAIAMTTYGVSGTYIDPLRAAAVLEFSNRAKKALNAQQATQLTLAGMHNALQSEVVATVNFQKEFNDYLSSYNNIIQIAAEVFGMTYEISALTKNIGDLTSVVGEVPGNVVAVALSERKNKIYSGLLMTSITIANDINKLVFTKSKMTEKERLNILLGMRPKLKLANRQLKKMVFYIRYTNLLDVWYNLLDNKYKPTSRQEIVERCRLRWKNKWIRN